MNEHDIVQGVAVEPAHGGKIPPVLIAVEKLPDALLNTIGDFFQPVLVALFFSHGKLLSDTKIAAPAQVIDHLLHRGISPHLEAGFGLPSIKSQAPLILHLESPGIRGFLCLYLRRFQ